MKKLFTLLGIMLCLAGLVSAQDCGFKVKFEVIPASCYNNGKVAYALLDANGNPILNAATMNLGDVRIYYKVNEEDSIHYGHYYTGGWDTLVMDYGSYIIGVEGSCRSTSGNYIKVDTQTTVNIPTTYTTPVAESFVQVADEYSEPGMRPTINCLNTGRVQLKIMNGKFPFKVAITNQATGETLRVDTIPWRQYNGYYLDRYDYRDYYSFDSLPAGVWQFHIVDGCEYGLPIHTQEVTQVDFPQFKEYRSNEVYLEKSSMYADTLGNQIIRVQILVDNSNNDYYNSRYLYNLNYMPRLVKYRFNYGNGIVSEWRPVPSHSNYNIYLNDTLRDVTLCEIFNKPVTIEYQDNCWGTTSTRSFNLYEPASYSYYANTSIDTIYDCHRVRAQYTRYYYIYTTRKVSTQSAQNEPFYKTLVWIYTDVNTGQVIKRDTINKLADYSYLYGYEIENLYGSYKNTPRTIQVRRDLVSDNCDTLVSRTDPLTFRYYDNNVSRAYWSLSHANGTCYTNSRSVSVYLYNYPDYSRLRTNGTMIRLVQSPRNNRYNFEATYDSITATWAITKSNLNNTSSISDYYSSRKGTGLTISEVGLPSGTYKFEIQSYCGDTIFTREISFSNQYEPYFVEEPSYTITEECTRSYLTYTAGKVGFHLWNTDPATGEYTVVGDDIPLITAFQIYNGPSGGFDNAIHRLNEPIAISMNGEYYVKLYYARTSTASYSSNFYCNNIYDTIYYNKNTVEFEYAVAIQCEPNSTDGNVYVKGRKGIAPYVYTLYSRADKQGEVLATNNTGIFPNIPMTPNDTLSCKVQDQCGAYFHVNIRPKTWTELQKVWFDNGLTVNTTCEGSTICVNAFEIGSILAYEWTGPNEFTDSESRSCTFIPREADEGWYKVHIYNSGCMDDYKDSIYLYINRSPSVALSQDVTVCPGASTELEFTPSSPNSTNSITFEVIFEDVNGRTTRTLTASPNETVKYTFTPLTKTKVYVTSINDGTCEYTIPEDTIVVDVHPIAPYTVTASHNTVCYESTATLSAFSSLTPPYAIRWYNDYNLTQLVKEDSIHADGGSSQMVLPGLTEDRAFYITVENEDHCPTIYGKPIQTVNMGDGTTQLSLGNTYRFYDSGGASDNYNYNEQFTHTFSSTDGKPVTLKFETLNLGYYSHLYIFSGPDAVTDSLLYDLERGTPLPPTIVSKGGTLTVYFVSGNYLGVGWNAIVEHEPAMAIATVRPYDAVTLRDSVCQSHFHTSYADPYGIAPNVTSSEELNSVIALSGNHTFEKTFPNADIHGCDSTVTFTLVVVAPSQEDTTVVITNMHHDGYRWFDSLYTQPGVHTHYVPLDKGCDLKKILNLIILDIDTSANEICLGDSTDLTLTVNVMTTDGQSGSLTSKTPCVGDVLCTDGSTLAPDDFLSSEKTAMGVVVQVNPNEGYGRAIALSGARNSTTMRWCYSGYSTINSITQTGTVHVALSDMNGSENTSYIVAKARAQNNPTNLNNTAAYHCMYYNHNTFTTGTDSLGWYMPSAGEMTLVYGNRVELNSTLLQLKPTYPGTSLLSDGRYWTSTEYNDSGFDYAWVNQNGQTTGMDKWGYYYVRPLIKFLIP